MDIVVEDTENKKSDDLVTGEVDILSDENCSKDVECDKTANDETTNDSSIYNQVRAMVEDEKEESNKETNVVNDDLSLSERLKLSGRLKMDLAASGKKPKLTNCGDIVLDFGEKEKKQTKLDSWFLKNFSHAKKVKAREAKVKEIQVSAISLEKNEKGEMQLQRKTFKRPVESTEVNIEDKPARCWVSEKKRLEEKLSRQRLEGLKKRTELFKEDNPDYERKEEEEEEGTLSDSDYSSSDEKEKKLKETDDEEENEDEDVEEERNTNALIEDEAEDDGSGEENSHSPCFEGESQEFSLRLTGMPETLELEDDYNLINEDAVCSNSANDFNKSSGDSTIDKDAISEDEPFVDSNAAMGVNDNNSSDLSSSNSMDILELAKPSCTQNDASQSLNSENQAFDSMDIGMSSFSLHLDDDSTLTQLPINDNGGTTSAISALVGPQSQDFGKLDGAEMPEELLMLCSGTFPPLQTPLESSEPNIEQKKQIEFPDDLLALCSGTFSADSHSKNLDDASSSSNNVILNDENARDGFSSPVDADDESDEDNDSVKKRKHKRRHRRVVLSDDDDEDEDSNDDHVNISENNGLEDEQLNSSDDEMAVMHRLEQKEKKGIRNKRGKLRNEFFENEAELSGSDIGSGDEVLGSEADEYEIEEGDGDQIPSDGELKNQIEKVYLKQKIDQDKRELLLYKEKYLEDADLHSDVNRKFRWRQREDQENVFLTDDSYRVMPTNGDAELVDDEMNEKWIAEKLEKVKWIKNEKAKKEKTADEVDSDEEMAGDNNSQLFALGKMALSRSNSRIPCSQNSHETLSEAQNLRISFSSHSTSKCDSRESFLSRDSSTLSLLVKTGANIKSHQESSKSLFTRLSPEKSGATVVSGSKRRKVTSSTNEGQIKKPKLINENSNSVFELL